MGRNLGLERTPDGRRFVVARACAAGRDAAWDLLTDTDRWPDWGPSVRAVDCDRRRIRTGTTGRVRVPGGAWIPFEVTACGASRWTWRVAKIPATGHRVDPPERVVWRVRSPECYPIRLPRDDGRSNACESSADGKSHAVKRENIENSLCI